MTRNKTAQITKILLTVIIVIVVIGYVMFNSRIFIAGPQIFIDYPKDGSSVSESPLISIQGRAYNISFLRLNDKQIYVDENGNFEESLLLYPGYNIIQFKAEDKFGRSQFNKLSINFNGAIIEQNSSVNDEQIVE